MDEETEYIRIARHLVRNWWDDPDYDDIVGTVVASVFEALAEVEGDREWRRRVAWRAARSSLADYWKYRLRQKRNLNQVALDENYPVIDDFSKYIVDKIAWDALLKKHCSERQERYLRYFYYDNLSYREIAALEGVKVKKVDNTLTQALKKLREELQPERKSL